MYGYGASDRQGNEANCEACGDHGKWPACNACGLCHDCKRYHVHAPSCSASADVTGLVQHSLVAPGATQNPVLKVCTPASSNQNDQDANDRRLRLTAGSQWLHKASGRRYTVLGFCKDATNGRAFGVLRMVRYRGADFVEWARAEVEFLDGRFEPLP